MENPEKGDGHKKFNIRYKIEIFCTDTKNNVMHLQKKFQNFLSHENIFFNFLLAGKAENHKKMKIKYF